jgi:GNAT superfamily N-acetyltransferase
MYHDPDGRHRIYELLGLVWPGMAETLALAERYGWNWHDIDTPFVSWEDDRAVSHVGLLCMPVLADGETRAFGGIHAVCTHPRYRGQGRSRRLMEAALEEADRRFATTFLTTGQPGLYERYGFRAIRESRVVLPAPPILPATPARELSDSPADVATLRRLLQDRVPVSRRLYARDSGWLVGINALLHGRDLRMLRLAEDLDAIFACSVKGRRLHLFDVFSLELPSLEEIRRRIAEPHDEVVLHVGWDRLAPSATPEPITEEDDFLMVRGAWPLSEGPFLLPLLNRC